MTEIDRSLIGSRSEPFLVEVEKGAIRRFAEAIDDPNPIYRDAEAARSSGFKTIVAPPTFPVTFLPPQEAEWTRNLDRRRVLAGEQSFAYERPIRAGDVLRCWSVFVGVDEKEGKSGRMEFLRQEVRGESLDGSLVFVNQKTTVYRASRSQAEG
jgi:acyl dehydratase